MLKRDTKLWHPFSQFSLTYGQLQCNLKTQAVAKTIIILCIVSDAYFSFNIDQKDARRSNVMMSLIPRSMSVWSHPFLLCASCLIYEESFIHEPICLICLSVCLFVCFELLSFSFLMIDCSKDGCVRDSLMFRLAKIQPCSFFIGIFSERQLESFSRETWFGQHHHPIP